MKNRNVTNAKNCNILSRSVNSVTTHIHQKTGKLYSSFLAFLWTSSRWCAKIRGVLQKMSSKPMKMLIVMIYSRTSSYEELLQIIIVIPENFGKFYWTSVFLSRRPQKPCAWFSTYFLRYLAVGRDPKSIEAFFFSNELETCRSDLHNQRFRWYSV